MRQTDNPHALIRRLAGFLARIDADNGNRVPARGQRSREGGGEAADAAVFGGRIFVAEESDVHPAVFPGVQSPALSRMRWSNILV